ncbi:MAG: HAMP domain-containing protein [Synergistales bacterium]|nr:HAMP domain-containing protein [Synergistales bacterium]
MLGNNVETQLKRIVIGIVLTLVTVLLGTGLYQGYRQRNQEAAAVLQRIRPVVQALSGEAAAPLLSTLEPWWNIDRIQSVSPELYGGELLFTADGKGWLLTLDRKKIWMHLLERNRPLLVVAVIAVLFSLEIVIFWAYGITRPLKRLAWGLDEVSRGNWVAINTGKRTPAEIRQLSRGFNTMVEELREWQQVQRNIARMERLAALGKLVAGVSHEIKNPLASLRIHIELLREYVHDEGREHFSIVEKELDRLNKIVLQLLRFSTNRSPAMQELPLAPLFEWCREILLVRLEEKRVSWNVDVPGSLTVCGEEAQLQQAFLNLSINAIEAMDEGGTLSIRAGRGEGGVAVSFVDTGPGVPLSVRERIFDPFFSTKQYGTGLGLSVTHQIVVDSHGGTIELVPRERGAEFRLTLPRGGAPCGAGMDRG